MFGSKSRRIAELEALARTQHQALHFTREYVGVELLPAIEGWSWFDARCEYDRVIGTPIALTEDAPPMVVDPHESVTAGPSAA